MTKEEAIKILSTRDAHGVLCGYTSGVTEALDMAIEALSQPIVAKHFDIQSGYIYCSPQIAENVKEVVRCKDCRHAYFKDFDKYCAYMVSALKPDGYCHRGERREE